MICNCCGSESTISNPVVSVQENKRNTINACFNCQEKNLRKESGLRKRISKFVFDILIKLARCLKPSCCNGKRFIDD